MNIYLKYRVHAAENIGEIVGIYRGDQPVEGQWSQRGIDWVKVDFTGDPYDNYLDLSGEEITAILKDEITAAWNATNGAVGDKLSLVGLPACEIFVDGKSQGLVPDGDGVYTVELLDAGQYEVTAKALTYKDKTYKIEVS